MLSVAAMAGARGTGVLLLSLGGGLFAMEDGALMPNADSLVEPMRVDSAEVN